MHSPFTYYNLLCLYLYVVCLKKDKSCICICICFQVVQCPINRHYIAVGPSNEIFRHCEENLFKLHYGKRQTESVCVCARER